MRDLLRTLCRLKQLALAKLDAMLVGSQRSTSVYDKATISVLAVGIGGRERQTLEEVASEAKLELAFAETWKDSMTLLRHTPSVVVLCDRDIPDTSWRTAIEDLARVAPKSCVVLVSAVNDEYLWQEVVQHGGFDVIIKPFRSDQIRRRIDDAWLFWKSTLR
jgi:DNA-binding NtrC family response regulator